MKDFLIARVTDLLRSRGLVIGQVSGYSAGIAAWLGWAKDLFGLVGVICGAMLSALSLWDYIQKRRKTHGEADES